MQRLKELPCRLNKIFLLVLFSISVAEISGVEKIEAQNLLPIYDGRVESASPVSPGADEGIIKRNAIPKARQIWKDHEGCQEDFSIIDAAKGSFTKPNAVQKAYLYRYCETGHNFANNGIVIMENGQIAAHVVYEGGTDNAIGALPDINGNGLSELIISNGSTNQGITVSVVIPIELSSNGVKKFGIADIYEDDCGAKENCKATAYRLLAKTGPSPIFYSETYRMRGKKWLKLGDAKQVSLRADETEYQLVK